MGFVSVGTDFWDIAEDIVCCFWGGYLECDISGVIGELAVSDDGWEFVLIRFDEFFFGRVTEFEVVFTKNPLQYFIYIAFVGLCLKT